MSTMCYGDIMPPESNKKGQEKNQAHLVPAMILTPCYVFHGVEEHKHQVCHCGVFLPPRTPPSPMSVG